MAKRHNNISETDEKPKFSKQAFKRALKLYSFVLPYKWQFIFGMIFLTLGSVLFLAVMKVPGEIFNIIDGKSIFNITLNQLFLGLFLLLLMQSLVAFLRVRLFAVVSEKSVANLRQNLYEKLITLKIPYLEERRIGELTSRISNDVTQVQSVMSVTLAEFVRQLITLVGGIAIIVFTMPRLALIILATFPFVVILAMFFGRFIRKLMKERQDKLANTNVIVEETMQSIHSVKAYTNEWFEVKRYVKELGDAVKLSLRAANFRGLFSGFIILIMFGALFFIMWRAALMVQSGLLPQGGLVDFVVYTGIIGASIASLGTFYTQLVAAIGAAERILDILEEEGEIDATKEIQPLRPAERFTGDVILKDLHFSYPSRMDVEVLKGINMRIAAGQKVALVGASGAGKSTIVQLLLQYYTPTEGEILVDDKNIQSIDLIKYRQNIAIVPQDVILFGGTIRENIIYGKPNSTEDEIRMASKKAYALDFIDEFPDGFDTLVGDRGIKLSGGQRQRIAIARAILNDPAILLLDEATSALDAESEKTVQMALERLMENRTSIIVAHRLSTIKNVDCIYVLEDGLVKEQGTHAELAAIQGGVYNSLVKLQFELY